MREEAFGLSVKAFPFGISDQVNPVVANHDLAVEPALVLRLHVALVKPYDSRQTLLVLGACQKGLF